jgi:hypothetical protein
VGVTAKDTSVAELTVKLTLPEIVPPGTVAVIVALPTPKLSTRPGEAPPLMAAPTAGLLVDQVTLAVRSWVD